MISICTPTYNRAHTLERLFESLVQQEKQNFEWIVIDDGSTDNTKKLVREFKRLAKFSVIYRYQKNQGKHIALNLGQTLASKKLFTCLDSDDWFTPNATNLIEQSYNQLQKFDYVGGLILLDKFSNEDIIGSELPNEQFENWINLYHTKKMKGDKCYVFITEIIQKYSFPYFPDNNHMPPSYQLYLISKDYDFYCINKPIKYVEYRNDGISTNIVKKYFSAPANYTYYRKSIHPLLPNFASKFKNSIHYNITKKLSRPHDELNVKSLRQKMMNALSLPISYLLLYYLKIKKRW